MAYNLFVAYDLMSPGQNYGVVQARIAELGPHHKFQFSLFYLHTDYTPQEVYDRVWSAMDQNDRLAVIIADGGLVTNWDHPPLDAINAIWQAA
ncbi:hypothetical protein HFO41_34595 [Rhizobium leguminosarum]|uniref:hypothetical protein n=1 Tax=Rhizobium leguminosarum TaxID=384 RepID=UPI001A91A435|nr:hypothetical protein [Rhizobium leguminosarum]MBY5557781.1 hypothetical protein [Rhizobium leguminosarum]MBY5638187.1 hypothetical protein [Rhizobium leguminosarum]MBY5693882.1 hypothetical protein [Rhizobium leguminosarum]MBY5722548.1 hypothetical protein [Rhizobium leguminosarum]QSW22808.1 hypothetical protein J0664_18820 [Rhizobium leguminosarum]